MNLKDIISGLGLALGNPPTGHTKTRTERRTRIDREKKSAQKRTSARQKRAKMKRHHRTSRKGRGKGNRK